LARIFQDITGFFISLAINTGITVIKQTPQKNSFILSSYPIIKPATTLAITYPDAINAQNIPKYLLFPSCPEHWIKNSEVDDITKERPIPKMMNTKRIMTLATFGILSDM
jgi:hypothetical protein